jgi:mevalonate kinase
MVIHPFSSYPRRYETIISRLLGSWGVAKASAPGKLILFGEHFVVYGLPAIATAIEARTLAEVQRATEFSLLDNRPETPGYKKEKCDQQLDSIQRMLKAMGLERKKVRIVLGGDLVAASGVGASGASCVAIAAALNEEFSLGLDRDRINDVAYEGEKGYHGVPSGIDNCCSTYGGFIHFRKDTKTGKNAVRQLHSKTPLSIVVGNTGLTSNTTKIVGDVRAKREKDPEKFKKIFDNYSKIAEEATVSVENGDLIKTGLLMNMNHLLLEEMGVSCDEIEELVDVASKNGALGAKLTGTGRGGLMVALVTGEAGSRVASAIKKAGYHSEMTKIGAEGVKVIR